MDWKLRLSACVLLLWSTGVWADIVCDSADDRVTTGVTFTTFASDTTSTLTLIYKPTGSAPDPGVNECFQSAGLFTNYSASDGWTTIGLFRHAALAGGDKLCGATFAAGSQSQVISTYTVNAWTELVHVHSGGQLEVYKDGLSLGSVSAGTLDSMTNAFLQLCGAPPSANYSGTGVFAAAAVYSTALSATQIAAVSKSQLRRLWSVQPTGVWDLDTCADGAAGHGVAFPDRSGNSRSMTGDDGANNTGMTCAASTYLTYPWGVMD